MHAARLEKDQAMHILMPRGHSIGQIRGRGCRKWRTVTSQCKKSEAALASAVRKMCWSDYHARALFIDDNPYYGPNVVMEAKRSR